MKYFCYLSLFALLSLGGCSLCWNAKSDQETVQCLNKMPKSDYIPPADTKVYVSLTTSPKRISQLSLVLDTLEWNLIDTAFLALPERYKNKETYGPTASLEARYPKLKVIRRTTDLGPIMKLVPAAQEIQALGETSAILITVDDDTGYPIGMIRELVRESNRLNAVVAGQGISSSLYGAAEYWLEPDSVEPGVNIVEGFSGVAYPVHLIDTDLITRLSTVGENNVCKTSDDVVISWGLALKKVGRFDIRNRFIPAVVQFKYGFEEDALHSGSNCSGEHCHITSRYRACAKALKEASNP